MYHPYGSTAVKLLYGEAFRAPNIYQLFYVSADVGFKANPDLRPETIGTLEMVWEQRWSDQISSTVTVYRYTMKDLIDQFFDAADEMVQHRNISRVRAHGGEIGLRGHMHNGMRGYASYSYQRAEDSATGVSLTNNPSRTAKAGLNKEVLPQLVVAGEMQYESDRKTVFDSRTNSRLLTNMTITVQPRFFRSSSLSTERMEVSISARNLFDVDYSTPGGLQHLQPAIGQNGRNFALRVGFSI